MRVSPACVLAVFAAMMLGACGSSYPRAQVEQAAAEMVRREYKTAASARLVGDTLFLYMNLPGLSTTDPKRLAEVFEKLQGAVLSVTRVALSSDAEIRYMVVVGSDPAWKLGLRLVQSLADIKGYFYQRISHDDYSERLILEIDEEGRQDVFSSLNGQPPVPLTPDEFAGRLVVSQFNSFIRNNPFLGVLLGNAKLRYDSFSGEELIVSVAGESTPRLVTFASRILAAESAKVARKYGYSRFHTVKLITGSGEPVLIPVTPQIRAN